jgi:hypothetical protein
MGLVALEAFESCLRHATEAGADYHLVGGLAVGFWAERYDALAGGKTIYSKDIDLRGTRVAAHLIGRLLRDEGHRIATLITATRKEPPGMGSNFVMPVTLANGISTTVEVLERMPWVDEPGGRARGVVMQIDGIRVLDPLSLFIGKLHAWHHRDDPDKTANDKLHLELLGEIIPKFLAEAARRGVDTRERKEALRAILDAHKTPLEEGAYATLRAAIQGE